MILMFNPKVLPRTMTRKEWRDIDRWRRLTQKDLRAAAQREEETLRHMCEDLGAFGTARLVQRIDRMVNPPVLIGPYQ